MIQQTSLETYFAIKPKLGRRQHQVLEALEEISPANNQEIAKHLGWPINSITPRVLELRQKGKVEEAYKQKNSQGRTTIYWQPKQNNPVAIYNELEDGCRS